MVSSNSIMHSRNEIIKNTKNHTRLNFLKSFHSLSVSYRPFVYRIRLYFGYCVSSLLLPRNFVTKPLLILYTQRLGKDKTYIERTTHQVPRPLVIEDDKTMKENGHVSTQLYTRLRFNVLTWKQPRLSSFHFVVFKTREEILYGGIPLVDSWGMSDTSTGGISCIQILRTFRHCHPRSYLSHVPY